MWNYEVYGLRLQSDRRIDGLIPTTHPVTADIVLDTSPFPPDLDSLFGMPMAEGGDNVAIAAAGGGHAVEYRDGTRFFIGPEGSLIRASWLSSSTPEDMATYLLGPVLAWVLRTRGMLCLHASAVVIEGRAVLLAAPHGGGKSTTASRFSDRGVPVMSDDVVPVYWREESVWAHAGYPRIRLWDETAEALYGNADALPRLTATWSKRYLDLQSETRQFTPFDHPLGAIFILGERHPGAAGVERLKGHAAAIRLIANTSMGLYLDAGARVAELEAITRLTCAVPVFLAHPTADLERIDELCDLIHVTAWSAL